MTIIVLNDDLKISMVNIMQLEDYFDFISPDDIRLKGHRIGIESILYEYLPSALKRILYRKVNTW